MRKYVIELESPIRKCEAYYHFIYSKVKQHWLNGLYVSIALGCLSGIIISWISIFIGIYFVRFTEFLCILISNILLCSSISFFLIYKPYLFISRRGICLYFLGANLLTFFRLAVLGYLNYRLSTHTWNSEFLSFGNVFLYPEMYFFTNTPFAYQDMYWVYPIQVLFLYFGSFLWVLPLLLVKSSKNIK